MGNNQNVGKINWNIWIPILLWVGCVILGIIKAVVTTTENINIKELIDVFNTNTFSTYLSVIVCRLYQYFTSKEAIQEQSSGLSRRNIPITIIITVIYCFIAAFDAAWNTMAMTIIYLVVNFVYVVCFFNIFLLKNK